MNRIIISTALVLALAPAANAQTTESLTATPVSASERSSNPVIDRLQLSYAHIGVSDTQKQQLRKLDEQIYNTRGASQRDDLKKWAEERQKILTPEQHQQVRNYLRQAGRAPISAAPEVTPASSADDSTVTMPISSETTGTTVTVSDTVETTR